MHTLSDQGLVHAEGRRRGRWLLLAGLVGVYASFGVVVTSMAPMLTLVQSELGASRTEMGFVLGAWALIFIGTAPVAGALIDRLGLRLAIAGGGASIALSALARSQADGIGSLWLAVALFGIGGPLVSTGAPTLVRRWFDDDRERRLAVGAYAVAPALGSIAVLVATNSVLLPLLGSWRRVLVVEAVVAVAALVVWLVVATVVETGHEVRPEGVTASTDGTGERLRALVASPSVRLALGLAFPVFFLNHALSNWQPTMLADFGPLSPSSAASWIAGSTAVGVIVALAAPSVVPGERRGAALAAVGVVLAVALAAMTVGGAVAVAAALVVGVRGLMVPVGALVLMESDGVTADNAGLANGMWFAVGEVGGVTGPLAVGIAADAGVGFGGAVVALVVVAVAMAIAAPGVDRARGGRGGPH